jgi:hypothetical protein
MAYSLPWTAKHAAIPGSDHPGDLNPWRGFDGEMLQAVQMDDILKPQAEG